MIIVIFYHFFDQMYANLRIFFQHPHNWDEVEKIIVESLNKTSEASQSEDSDFFGDDRYKEFFIDQATIAIRNRLHDLHLPHTFVGEYYVGELKYVTCISILSQLGRRQLRVLFILKPSASISSLKDSYLHVSAIPKLSRPIGRGIRFAMPLIAF